MCENEAAATYKLTELLLRDNSKQLVNEMNTYLFIINMEELFSVFVGYFDEVTGKSVVEHYQTIQCIVFNAETLLNEGAKLFLKDNIAYNNLVGNFSDRTSYMSGKNVLEINFQKRLRLYLISMKFFIINLKL